MNASPAATMMPVVTTTPITQVASGSSTPRQVRNAQTTAPVTSSRANGTNSDRSRSMSCAACTLIVGRPVTASASGPGTAARAARSFLLDALGDELLVAHRPEAHPDAGGTAVGRDQRAAGQAIGEDPLAQRRRVGGRLRQGRHQRRAAQAAVVELDALHGAQAGDLLDVRQARQCGRETVDARQRRRREDVVGEQADDRHLLAPECAPHAVVKNRVGVALRQQAIDGAVDPKPRRQQAQADGERRDDQ